MSHPTERKECPGNNHKHRSICGSMVTVSYALDHPATIFRSGIGSLNAFNKKK